MSRHSILKTGAFALGLLLAIGGFKWVRAYQYEGLMDPLENVEANYFQIGLMAAVRKPDQRPMRPDATLSQIGRTAKRDPGIVCGYGAKSRMVRANKVTHYYVPLLRAFNKHNCHTLEGVCRFWQNGEEHIANYGKPSVPLKSAWCKNGVGYGIEGNCTHPCRTLAAAHKIHKGGEILFFPELVGKRCGTGENAMIHDGFMLVNDTGAPKHFNRAGRFDFFWGQCRNFSNGICWDPGAVEIKAALSNSNYCRVWYPGMPGTNAHVKNAFVNAVRAEAIAHGDPNAAQSLNLDAWVGRSYSQVAQALKPNRSQKRRLASAR